MRLSAVDNTRLVCRQSTVHVARRGRRHLAASRADRLRQVPPTQGLQSCPSLLAHLSCVSFYPVSFNPFIPTDFFLIVAKVSLPRRSGPYWSNRPFLISDIRALWRSGLSARVPECQKIKNGRLDQYDAEHLEV